MRDDFDLFYNNLIKKLEYQGKIRQIVRKKTQYKTIIGERSQPDWKNILINVYPDEEIEKCRLANNIIVIPRTTSCTAYPFIKSFVDLRLSVDINNKMKQLNINHPTSIQMQVIPLVLCGYNVFGQSVTGSGKTLCYTLPLIIMKTSYDISFTGALILVPTRELCLQIQAFLENFVDVRSIYGGTIANKTIYKHTENSNGPLYVATPGKLLKLLKKRNFVHNFSHLILDEADKMIGTEFIKYIRKIIKKMSNPLFCVLSATNFKMDFLLKETNIDVSVLVNTEIETSCYVTQRINLVTDKLAFTTQILRKNTLLFVNSKDKADELALQLQDIYKRNMQAEQHPDKTMCVLNVASLHAGKDQIDRDKIIREFRDGKINVLVSTGLLSRGIDFQIDCVINYDFPDTIEDYIHRIGRTGRMQNGTNKQGIAYTLCCNDEIEFVKTFRDFFIKNNVQMCDKLLSLLNKE